MNEIMNENALSRTASAVPTITDGDASPLDEIALPFTVPLGSAELSIGELLALGPGSGVTLEGAADGPVPMMINGLPVATGKLVLVDGSFALQIESVEAGADQKLLKEQEPAAAPTVSAGDQPHPVVEDGPAADTEVAE